MKTGENYRVVIDDEPKRFTVKAELAFRGTRWQHGREQSRWNEVEVIETAKGKFILGRYYITCWQGESGEEGYLMFDSLDELAKALDATNDLDREVLEKLGKLDEVSEEV
jgi:hypothetical protein